MQHSHTFCINHKAGLQSSENATRFFIFYKMLNTIIFDLDGTLLNTLTDLANSVNYALRTHGLPTRSLKEVRSFLGNGIRYLMQQAVGDAVNTDEAFEAIFQTFRTHYVAHCLDTTEPYPGIMPLLGTLKAKGIKMAIVSNKLHPAVQELAQRFFKGYITTAVGESETVRRKPCPDAVLAAMKELGSNQTEAIYVGDSEVDLQTALNAQMPCALVTWGFRDEAFLHTLPHANEASFIHSPADLLSLF